jgi:hypothetical protein
MGPFFAARRFLGSLAGRAEAVSRHPDGKRRTGEYRSRET